MLLFKKGSINNPVKIIKINNPYNVNLLIPILTKGKGKNKIGLENCSKGVIDIK